MQDNNLALMMIDLDIDRREMENYTEEIYRRVLVHSVSVIR